MKKKEKILIGILLILLLVVGSIYINVKFTNNENVIQKQETSKGQLSETSGENAYVSTESHLAEVNAQNQQLTDLNTQISNTTVTADRLLKGYTAYKNGEIITGTMPNNGALNWSPTTSTSYTVPAGYYSGGTLNSAGAYNAGVSATKKGTAGQAQVLSGYTFTNASGVGLSGSMTNRGAWTSTPTGSGKVTIPAGYHNGSGYVNTATVYTNGYNAGVAAGKNCTITGLRFFGQGTSDVFTETYSITSSMCIVSFRAMVSQSFCKILSTNGTLVVAGNEQNGVYLIKNGTTVTIQHSFGIGCIIELS